MKSGILVKLKMCWRLLRGKPVIHAVNLTFIGNRLNFVSNGELSMTDCRIYLSEAMVLVDGIPISEFTGFKHRFVFDR